jgi:hypothetical protein
METTPQPAERHDRQHLAPCRAATSPNRRLAVPLELERVYDPDRDAMVAALRVVLGLPRQLPDRGQGRAS